MYNWIAPLRNSTVTFTNTWLLKTQHEPHGFSCAVVVKASLWKRADTFLLTKSLYTSHKHYSEEAVMLSCHCSIHHTGSSVLSSFHGDNSKEWAVCLTLDAADDCVCASVYATWNVCALSLCEYPLEFIFNFSGYGPETRWKQAQTFSCSRFDLSPHDWLEYQHI